MIPEQALSTARRSAVGLSRALRRAGPCRLPIACPTGKSAMLHFDRRACHQPCFGATNRHAPKSRFSQSIQADLGCPVVSRKIFLFFRIKISAYPPPRSGPTRGAYARSSRTWGRNAVDAAASGAVRRSQGGLNPVSGLRRARTNGAVSSSSPQPRPAGAQGCRSVWRKGESRVRQNRVVLTPVAGVKPAEANRPNRVRGALQSAGDGDKNEFVAGESTA